jgi:hypothetical protein
MLTHKLIFKQHDFIVHVIVQCGSDLFLEHEQKIDFNWEEKKTLLSFVLIF